MGNECVILSLEKEYPGYTGTEKWMIITDLTENEFAEQYPEQYPCWKEAVIMSVEMGKEVIRYHNNNRKHAIRNADMVPLQDIEAIPQKKVVKDNTIKDPFIKAALGAVTEKQRRRILGFYQAELTKKEIAEAEECSTQAVGQSIDIGIKRIKKYMAEAAAKKVGA